MEQQLIDAGCISRTPKDVVDDVAGAWGVLDHRQGTAWHLRSGLSNKLDATEDDQMGRETFAFWEAAGMHAARKEAMAHVDSVVDSGQLVRFSQWRDLTDHADDSSIVAGEGVEFEGDLEPGEKCYFADGEEETLSAENDAAGKLADVAAAAAVLPLVRAAPGDDPTEVEEATALP